MEKAMALLHLLVTILRWAADTSHAPDLTYMTA